MHKALFRNKQPRDPPKDKINNFPGAIEKTDVNNLLFSFPLKAMPLACRRAHPLVSEFSTFKGNFAEQPLP